MNSTHEALFNDLTLRLFFTLLSERCMFVLRVSACISFHVCNIYSADTPEGLMLAFIRVSNQAHESRVDLCTVLFLDIFVVGKRARGI